MKKRTTARIITFLSAAALVTGALALRSMDRARQLELSVRAGTQRAFDELVTSVSELSNCLEKSLYITDPTLESALCTQIYCRAAAAQTAMGALPGSSDNLEQMTSFLSRVGDYACALSRTVGGNGGCSEEERSNLTELARTASVMQLNLQDMQARMQAGTLTLDETRLAASSLEAGEQDAPMAGTVFQSIEAEFPELPTLIYDGPFSESLTRAEPLYLADMEEVGEAAARRAAADFLGVGETEVVFQGDCGGKLPCRRYVCYGDGGEYTVYVTNRGGQILSSLCSRLPGTPRLDTEAALSVARRFLARQGFQDMAESYHMAEDGVLVANFAYEQEGVMCYPDLVKVGVALDTGAVMSFDARGYLSSHRERELPEAVISEQDARDTVPETLTVRQEDLALIPSEGGEERLCRELVCQAQDGRQYILYVNAVTGKQEKILILLEDASGALTV